MAGSSLTLCFRFVALRARAIAMGQSSHPKFPDRMPDSGHWQFRISSVRAMKMIRQQTMTNRQILRSSHSGLAAVWKLTGHRSCRDTLRFFFSPCPSGTKTIHSKPATARRTTRRSTETTRQVPELLPEPVRMENLREDGTPLSRDRFDLAPPSQIAYTPSARSGDSDEKGHSPRLS